MQRKKKKRDLKKNANNYKPNLDIIETKAKSLLDSPLRLASYLLNRYYYFKDDEFIKIP